MKKINQNIIIENNMNKDNDVIEGNKNCDNID